MGLGAEMLEFGGSWKEELRGRVVGVVRWSSEAKRLWGPPSLAVLGVS